MNVKYPWLLPLAVVAEHAQALEVGHLLTPWTLLDQYDQAFTLDNRTTTNICRGSWNFKLHAQQR